MTSPRDARSTSKGRMYRWRNQEFVSVTTVISGGVPKPALKPWGEKMVATAAVEKHSIWSAMGKEEAIDWLKRAPFRDTDKAAAQGSDIHDWAEKYTLGEPVTVEAAPEAQQGYLKGFLRFIAEHDPKWEMAEASVYNRTYGYAGTLDALLRIPALGEGLTLCDYKTTRSGIYGEVALQLAAYRNAEFIGLPDGTEHPMPPVESCAALWLTPTGYHLYPVQADAFAFEYFLAAMQVRDFTTEVGRQLILPEVPASRFGSPPGRIDPAVFTD